jgi:hypothetical protein
MPTWLYYAIPAGLFIGVVAAFAWGLCAAASQGDELWDRITDRRMLDEGESCRGLHSACERRTRRDARNGLGRAS